MPITGGRPSTTPPLTDAMQRFSDNLRINGPGDEFGGLYLAENMNFETGEVNFFNRPRFRSGLSVVLPDGLDVVPFDVFVDAEIQILKVNKTGKVEITGAIDLTGVDGTLPIVVRDGVAIAFNVANNGGVGINIHGDGAFNPLTIVSGESYTFFDMNANGMVVMGSTDSGRIITFNYDGSESVWIDNTGTVHASGYVP